MDPAVESTLFFREKGLEHGQTGGISVTFEVLLGTKSVHNENTKTHLKQGDKTSPEGAARLCYQVFTHERCTYVAILYAGPHPERDLRWTCQLPELPIDGYPIGGGPEDLGSMFRPL